MKEVFYTIIALLFTVGTISAQTNIAKNRAAYHSSAMDYNQTAHLVSDGNKTTFWQSKLADNQWIYLDLGYTCPITEIQIYWGENYAADFHVQLADAENHTQAKWTNFYSNKNGKGGVSKIKKSAKARFVKILANKSAKANGFSINEIEVYGKTPETYSIKALPAQLPDGRQYLTGGNWKIQRAAFVSDSGNDISLAGFKDKDWLPTTVPATAFVSYLNAGAVPDPFYADQQFQISESFFTADFWYKNSFFIPQNYNGGKIWLNFDGINWKADVFFNGVKLGYIEGAYTRAKFDISGLAKFDQENFLAVLIHKNEHPGEVTEQHLNDPDGNGGIIGYDSPTVLAGIGWNWLPTIRGRNIGIWNDVYLSSTGSVSIDNPFVKTDFMLPDTTQASVRISLALVNHAHLPLSGMLEASFSNVELRLPVSLKANEVKNLVLEEQLFHQLKVKNPKLWWPNGYGVQNLDTLKLSFTVDNKLSDSKELVFGFREYSYHYNDNLLQIAVNGYPVLVRGGNWGMAEGLMRCDKEGYDLRVRLHKEMNMNMIRNWVGMVGDDEFYQACDKYGIMVWDDFWLANPVDGPHPKNNDMFMKNARDKILQRRSHACLALWCGRNEGYPPAVLDSAMAETISELDDSRHYISSSAHKPVTGLGPYETKDPAWYFQNRGKSFHSEQGIVCFPSYESLQKMMPEEKLWPINDMWGLHDWTQPRVQIFTDDMNKSYGIANSAKDFSLKAQMLNMEGPKAMVESWQSNRVGGVLVWMTHSAWPSLICQSYDYYFEPTAAFFAFKQASEPIHVFWRIDNNKVQVANNTLKDITNHKLVTKILDFFGNTLFVDSSSVAVKSNAVSDIIKLEFPKTDSGTYFILLNLYNNRNEKVSENFYWNSSEYQNYKALNSLPNVKLSCKGNVLNKNRIKVEVKNPSKNIALMTRLKLVDEKTGVRILPIFYSENYFSLSPGGSKVIEIETVEKIGAKPTLIIEGWNIEPEKIIF